MCKKTCNLIKELPEFRLKIAELELTDKEFAKLLADYCALEQQITAMEQNTVADFELHIKDLKTRCITIKDRLYIRLKHAP
ncbi:MULTISPECIES: YdcH family protein [Pseudoalteromonas]|uniref:DUF465 domain-containing protein n=1 Tax=Pseudoalteromonas luteoviolacea (strain 2ta16) TaxID=1353533 RepID=V4HVM8_PSEL2|nr:MULTISPECIES: DUF465 domain-containing protein [Pseudoalteromonas]ESP92009.1 hypothetical protein PL2TA16_04845 [Pseudoalteromonas luteoviolacea 2ta16]KZN29114.1 hypothetical protein N483_06705 [Pseudoalteromonas luteoviolacea NCIMB 1944]MCG7546899.1 DUF465 domain-containing protein [Pseudoalteromonas sp. Of7M-16]